MSRSAPAVVQASPREVGNFPTSRDPRYRGLRDGGKRLRLYVGTGHARQLADDAAAVEQAAQQAEAASRRREQELMAEAQQRLHHARGLADLLTKAVLYGRGMNRIARRWWRPWAAARRWLEISAGNGGIGQWHRPRRRPGGPVPPPPDPAKEPASLKELRTHVSAADGGDPSGCPRLRRLVEDPDLWRHARYLVGRLDALYRDLLALTWGSAAEVERRRAEWLEESSLRRDGAGPLDDLLADLVQVEWLVWSLAEAWSKARSTVQRQRQAWSARRHFERRAWQLTRLQGQIARAPSEFDGPRVFAKG